MDDAFSKGLYVVGRAENTHERQVLELFWTIFWFELLRKTTPIPLCILIDEGTANGPIPNVLETLVTLGNRGISLIQCFQSYADIASIYGHYLARTVFDEHQTHIWLTKGLAKTDIETINQTVKSRARTHKTRYDDKLEPGCLLSRNELTHYVEQEKYLAIIDGVGWTTSGHLIIASLVPVNDNCWNWRATSDHYNTELARLGYGVNWRSPYKMRSAGIVTKAHKNGKMNYQCWIPIYSHEAALHGLGTCFVPINDDQATELASALIIDTSAADKKS